MDAPRPAPPPPQQPATTANTCVCVRLRPPSAQERGARCIRGDATDAKRVQFAAGASASGGSSLQDGGAYSVFEFDGVFGASRRLFGLFLLADWLYKGPGHACAGWLLTVLCAVC